MSDGADWVLIGVLIAARVALSVLRISEPGLQQDEVLFVNAATLQLPGIFLIHQVAGIPVMVFPYIGALKSWLYIPIFSLFGQSAMTIRLPVELITSAGLVVLYPALRRLVNRPVALLSVVLLCFDNSLFWLTRDDVGPSAIDFFLKCAALLCLSALWRGGRLRSMILLLLVLGLGVLNKLSFIWIVNAAVLVSLVFGIAERERLRRRPDLVGAWIAGLVVIYGAFGAYYLANHIGAINPAPPHTDVLTRNWPLYLSGTEAVVSGTWFFSYALAPLGPQIAVFSISLALFVAGTVASMHPKRTRNLPVACLALATVAVTLQILVTFQATAGWHYISIYPYSVVVGAYGAWALLRLARIGRVQVAAALCLLAVAALAYDGVLMGKYFDQLDREPRNAAWTPAIYRLDAFLHHQPGLIYTADWGILPSLFALHPASRYVSLDFALENSDRAQLRKLAKEIARIPVPKLIVTHTGAKIQFRKVNANLYWTEKGHLQLIATIRGQQGVPVFHVYRYR